MKLPFGHKTLTLVAVLSTSVAQASDSIPAAPSRQPIALVGATVHPVSTANVSNGTVLIDKGKIVAVGRKIEIPQNAQVIDVSGQHIYPGLIAVETHLGLTEISAVRATRDIRETGTINPNVRAERAVNPDSELLPVTRSNGVLVVVTQPDGGLIAGMSAVVQLDGWTWEDMTLKAPAALHIQWPRMAPTDAWWLEQSQKEQIEQRDKQLRSVHQAFDDARAYLIAKRAHNDGQGPAVDRDARWEAMAGVLDRTVPVIIEANRIEQIQSAVAFARQQQVRLILAGGYDAPLCADLLKAHDVPVIVSGIHRLPLRRSEGYDTPYTVPERLRKAGIEYCISGNGRFSTANARNLPYHAATAAAYGLPRDEALRAITLYAARILDVADRVGSLEEGKDATLIVTDGDPLDTPTQVLDAFIAGRRIDLADRHKRLWKKYQQKYQQQRGGRK